MTDPRGIVIFSAGGKEYRCHMGNSVLADLQGKHGQDVLAKIDPPENAPKGWLPDLNIICDLILFSLQRYHGDEADRYLVDDIMAENPDAFGRIMTATFPDPEPSASKKPKALRGRR